MVAGVEVMGYELLERSNLAVNLLLLVMSRCQVSSIYRAVYVENGVCYLHQSRGRNVGEVVMVQQERRNLPKPRLSHSHRSLEARLTERPPDEPLGIVWRKGLLVRRLHNSNPVAQDVPEVVRATKAAANGDRIHAAPDGSHHVVHEALHPGTAAGTAEHLNQSAAVLVLEVLGDGAEARGGAAPVDAVPGEQQRRVRAYEGQVVLQEAIAEGERGPAGGHVERELQPALDGVRVVPAVQVHAEHAAGLRLHKHPPPPHRRRGPLELLGLVPPGRAEETPQEQRRHLALDGAVQVGGHGFFLFLVRVRAPPCGEDDAVRERGRCALGAIIGSRLQTNHHQEDEDGGNKKRR
uniref:Uncharacterized protein n=1 Tax=Zea mays TaxID=4577 RepID=A0A804RQP4_MAIZE